MYSSQQSARRLTVHNTVFVWKRSTITAVNDKAHRQIHISTQHLTTSSQSKLILQQWRNKHKIAHKTTFV